MIIDREIIFVVLSLSKNETIELITFYYKVDLGKIFSNCKSQRKLLKGSPITIREDLTRMNQALINRAVNHPRIERAWSSWNGKGVIITADAEDTTTATSLKESAIGHCGRHTYSKTRYEFCDMKFNCKSENHL